MNVNSLFSKSKDKLQALDEPAKILWKEVINSRPGLLPCRVFENFALKNKKAGDIFVSTAKVEKENRFKILVNNKFGKELGYEEFDINPRNKNIFGYFIKVSIEYRQRGYRLGELIRLASIMEMMENNSRQISIYSKDTAVYFHSKYKFRPAIYKFTDRDYALKTIMNDKASSFSDLAKEAKRIFKEAQLTQNDAQVQRDLCTSTNELVQRYIQRALQESEPEKNHPFCWGMNMLLTKKDVKDNKEFFNELFKEQGIDYKI